MALECLTDVERQSQMVKIDPGKVSTSKKRLFQIQSEKRSRTKRPVPVVANKFTKIPPRLASFEKGMSA